MTFLRTAAGMALAVALCGSCTTSTVPGTGPSSPAPATTTVRGRVVETPMCPVQHVGTRCPPRPVAHVQVIALAGRRTVASTRTDHTGHFRLALAPGRYLLRATLPSALRSTGTAAVQVGADPVAVTITLDSGIR